jgi:hypothetical protein
MCYLLHPCRHLLPHPPVLVLPWPCEGKLRQQVIAQEVTFGEQEHQPYLRATSSLFSVAESAPNQESIPIVRPSNGTNGHPTS